LALVACGNNNNGGKTIDAPGAPGAGPDGGGSGSGGGSGGGGGGGNGGFTLTTTAFKPGAAIPDANTCNGANTSPDLAWTNPPTGAKSFAVVLTDRTATLTHWVIYDIPATATSLPAHIDNTFQPANVTGAHQTVSVMSQQPKPVIGYFGPCPPQPPAHTYQFTVYALDVATLPGLSGTSLANDGLAEVVIHQMGSASFTGDYVTPAKP
jgi:Raf kinase inhibitor-like YbhB/YbcL family protein